MNLNLSGKTALVCGSTQGIGLAAAHELALLGAEVILMARNEEKLREAKDSLPFAKSQQHSYIVADFNDPDNVKAAIQQFKSKGGKVHILVNNTGGPPAGAALDAHSDDFIKAFNSHLICNQLLVQAVVSDMKSAGYGRIINIISTSVKQPIPGLGVSNTIRGAVANWSKTLAGELGPFGITVNNVLPGLTHTSRADYFIKKKAEDSGLAEKEMIEKMVSEIPARRMGQAAELGSAIAFLASPAAAYINGINLPVDGGRLACL